jgi:hypothetical protein
MGFWDAATHMSKQEWSSACRRVVNRLQNLKLDASAPAPQPRTTRGRGKKK